MFSQKNHSTKILSVLIKTYLLILPWQTVWIIQERYLNGYKWQYGTIQFFLSELFIWLVFLVFFLWSWQRLKTAYQEKKIKFSWTRDRIFALFVLLFLIYSLLSIIWSPDKEIALRHSLYFIESFLLFFLLYLVPISKKEIIYWLLLGSIIPALLGMAQFVSQATWPSKWLGLPLYLPHEAGTSIIGGTARWLRAYGSFQHPNIFGGYLAVVLILLLYYLRDCHIKEFFLTSQRNLWVNKKIAFSLIIIILSWSLFFSFSRSAWMMLILALIAFIYFGLSGKTLSKNFMVFLSIPIFIFVIGGIIYSPLIKARWAETTNFGTASAYERVSGYKEAKKIILENPWLGVGSGNYTAASFLLDHKRPGWEYQPVHNVLLLFLAEMGILGVSIFVGLLASFIRFFLALKPKKNAYLSLFLLLSLAPGLLLDHYFLSGYFGLVFLAVYMAGIFKDDVHS